MNANLNYDLRQNNNDKLVSDECNCSMYSLAAVASGIVLLLGIIVYALIV